MHFQMKKVLTEAFCKGQYKLALASDALGMGANVKSAKDVQFIGPPKSLNSKLSVFLTPSGHEW